jgi:predicted nucleic acid-binding protein
VPPEPAAPPRRKGVLLDTNVLINVFERWEPAADGLRNLLRSGIPVFVSHLAYAELTSYPGKKQTGWRGARNAEEARARKAFFDRTGINRTPFGPTPTESGSLFADLIVERLDPASETREDRRRRRRGKKPRGRPNDKEDPDRLRDFSVVAEAIKHDLFIWTYDKEDILKHRDWLFEKYGVVIHDLSDRTRPPTRPPGSPHPKSDYQWVFQFFDVPERVDQSGRVTGPRRALPTDGLSGRLRRRLGPVKRRIGSALRAINQSDDALELIFAFVNLLAGYFIDKKQGRLAEAAWKALEPGVLQHLEQFRDQGVLAVFVFSRLRKEGPQNETPMDPGDVFEGIDIAYGKTFSEALASVGVDRTPVLVGPNQMPMRSYKYIPPLDGVDVRQLQTPFVAQGLGKFLDGRLRMGTINFTAANGFSRFEEVDLGNGFDDLRFLILVPPTAIEFPRGSPIADVEIDTDIAVAGASSVEGRSYLHCLNVGRFSSTSVAMVLANDAQTDAALLPEFKFINGLSGLINSFAKTRFGPVRMPNIERVRFVRVACIHVLKRS